MSTNENEGDVVLTVCSRKNFSSCTSGMRHHFTYKMSGRTSNEYLKEGLKNKLLLNFPTKSPSVMLKIVCMHY